MRLSRFSSIVDQFLELKRKMSTTSNETTATYVVMSQDYVVLRDLCDTILEFDPAAHLLHATTLASASAFISGSERVAVAILEAGPERISQTGLDTMVRTKGGRLVLLGPDAEDEDEAGTVSTRCTVLTRPFSAEAVCTILAACLGGLMPTAF
jgi:hypothetical protein